MRKLICCLLVLTMVCGLFGCGRKKDNTTAATDSPSGYDAKDFSICRAIHLAQQLGLAAESDYAARFEVPDTVAEQMAAFSAAAQPDAVTSGAFMSAEGMNIPTLVSQLNTQVGTNTQVAAVSILQFSTQFYCPVELPVEMAVYLSYGHSCNILVLFTPLDDQLVRATVYPLLPKAASELISKYFQGSDTVSSEEIQDSRSRCADVSCMAAPTGNPVSVSYYSNMAKDILADVKSVSQEPLQKYTSDSELIAQASGYIQSMSGEPIGSAVYHFPASPETTTEQMPALALQQMYLTWANNLCATFGSQALASSALVCCVIQTRNPGIAAAENEVPVLVALDYSDVTVVVTIYANEYHAYLYSVTCLPCDLATAVSLLESMGATQMV